MEQTMWDDVPVLFLLALYINTCISALAVCGLDFVYIAPIEIGRRTKSSVEYTETTQWLHRLTLPLRCLIS